MLAAAVRAVLDQDYTSHEIIVVNDGGSDPTPHLPDDSRIRYLENETSQGPAHARNRGLALANGEFVLFLDDDDLFSPGRLSRTAKLMGGADIVVCAGGAIHDSRHITRYSQLAGRGNWRVVADTTAPNLGCIAVRRSIAPMFDTQQLGSQDIEWYLRLPLDAVVRVSDEVGWLWRRHNGPRKLNGIQQRIDGSKRLMIIHDEFFTARPNARAFRWYRIGVMHLGLDERSEAIRSFLTALRYERRPGQLIRIARRLFEALVASFKASLSRSPTATKGSDWTG